MAPDCNGMYWWHAIWSSQASFVFLKPLNISFKLVQICTTCVTLHFMLIQNYKQKTPLFFKISVTIFMPSSIIVILTLTSLMFPFYNIFISQFMFKEHLVDRFDIYKIQSKGMIWGPAFIWLLIQLRQFQEMVVPIRFVN